MTRTFSVFTVRPMGKLPLLIDITEPQNLHGHNPAQVPVAQTSSPGDLLKAGFKAAEGSLNTGDPAGIRYGSNAFNEVGLCFFGADPTMPAIDRPPYSDLVVPGALNFVDNAHSVFEVAPSAAVAVNLDQIKAKVQHLIEVRKTRDGLLPVVERYTRTENNLTQEIHQDLSRVYDLASGAILSNVTVSANLAALIKLFTQGGVDSQEAKKNNERVAEKAVEETLDKVKKALDESKKAQPPGAPPPPTVDLDTLKGRRTR